MECWDDDEDILGDDIDFRAPSISTTFTNHRASIDSRLSGSDIDWNSNANDDNVNFDNPTPESRHSPQPPQSAYSSPQTSKVVAPIVSVFDEDGDDEGFDDLELPDTLDLGDVLKRRHQTHSPDSTYFSSESQAPKSAPVEEDLFKEDFFADFDLGDGDVFDTGKLTLNRNIKHETSSNTSPARRLALTLTHKDRISTKIPRPIDRRGRLGTHLEPVSEDRPTPRPHRRHSPTRHSPQSSLSNVRTPGSPTFSQPSVPSTPSRREHAPSTTEVSGRPLRYEATTTSAQLLNSKRSLPALRVPQSPARPPPRYGRVPSRAEGSGRPLIPNRSKTPVERSGAESSLGSHRRHPVPFLPAGAAGANSHHITTKSSRHLRRQDSESSIDQGPPRSLSRLTYNRPMTPTARGRAPESLTREAAAKRTLTKPARSRAYGTGSELEVFADLPTSAVTESKYVKQPVGRGAPKALRTKLSQNNVDPRATGTPIPWTSAASPTRTQDQLPRFARDTAASRIAREQGRLARENKTGGAGPGPLGPVSMNNKTPNINRDPFITPRTLISSRKRTFGNQKPQLIKPESPSGQERSIKGMRYNPVTFRWEGNENALLSFENPPSSPRHNPPALITNISSKQGVQVVGEMVFDPQRMCWLKMAPQPRGGRDSMSPSTVEDEEDPFAGLDDLEDASSRQGTGPGSVTAGNSGGGSVADEWLVGEEFDVGPEFIRRQREEEDRWRKKLERWAPPAQTEESGKEEWRWDILTVAAGLDMGKV